MKGDEFKASFVINCYFCYNRTLEKQSIFIKEKKKEIPEENSISFISRTCFCIKNGIRAIDINIFDA